MATQKRNRIIYQSQALFISPSSTGYHLQESLEPVDTHGSVTWTGLNSIGDLTADAEMRSLTQPLERIQSINFNFAINRTDINEFGRQARLGSLVMESPTVALDFNYYLTNGGNERKMGFNIPTNVLDGYAGGGDRASASDYYSTGDLCLSGYSAISGLLEDNQGNNYFILVSKEGTDVHRDTKSSNANDFDVISIGNGFISNYSIDASVGAIPEASVSVEAFNIKVDDVMSGNSSTAPLAPYVQPENGLKNSTTQFVIQGSESYGSSILNTTGINGTDLALRPGDITFSISNSGSYQGFTTFTDDGEAHIQSVSINVPLTRSVLQRLGSTFGYARVIETPINIDVTVSAIINELKANNLYEKLCSTQNHDFTLTFYGCDPSTGGKTTDYKMQYVVKGARMDDESFSNAIGGGDGETVDITFTCQVGGANDITNGIFMYGSYPLFRVLPFFPLGAAKDDDASYSG